MNRIQQTIFAGAAFLISLWSVSAAAAELSETPSRRHPYLFCTPDTIAVLQQKIDRNPAFAEAWKKVRQEADRFAVDSSAGLNRVETLGLAYQMTKEDKYAAKARDILLRESRKDAWHEQILINRTPPWRSGLEMARNCYAMAFGFDSIYESLSGQERQTIAQGLIRLGVLPALNDWLIGSERIHSLDTMGHNWWSACVFTAGVGAMAVMNEEPQARGWLEKISDSSLEWFEFGGSVLQNKPRSFDSEGGFYESVNYANFGLSEYLLFRLAWRNAMAPVAPPVIPTLDKAGDFFIHAGYPNAGPLMSVNFGDSSITANGARSIVLLTALGDRRDRYLWYLSKIRQGQFREGADPATPLGLLIHPDIRDAAASSPPDLPTSILMKDMGWAMMRSSWADDATLLAVKSGFTWNHAHADAGSFILFHDGENLLIDSGNCSYGFPEYTGYYCRSVAHNVVLFDGTAQNPEDDYYGVKTPGQLYNLMDAGTFKYVMADATGPTAQYFSRNYRHFLWIGDVILIIDDLKTHAPGQFEWLLHYGGSAQRRGQDIQITKGRASVRVRPLFPERLADGGSAHDFPEQMRLVERAGLTDRDPKTPRSYFAILPPETSRREKFITAIFLDTEQNKDPSPRLERLEGKDMIGVRVRDGKTTTEVYLNLLADGRIKHRNSNTTMDGWETDALIVAVTTRDGASAEAPDHAKRIFVAHGSYLRKGDKTILDSLSKVFLVAEHDGAAMGVWLSGQRRIAAQVYAGRVPEVLRVNGDIVAPDCLEKDNTILLRLLDGTVQGR